MHKAGWLLNPNAGVLFFNSGTKWSTFLQSSPLFLGVLISYSFLLSQQLSKAFNTLIFSYFFPGFHSTQQLSKASYRIIFILQDVTFLISYFFFITVPKSFFPFQNSAQSFASIEIFLSSSLVAFFPGSLIELLLLQFFIQLLYKPRLRT